MDMSPNELESDGEVGKVGVSIQTILNKTGQQKTFQYTPVILTCHTRISCIGKNWKWNE